MTRDEIIKLAREADIDPYDMCEDPRIATNNLIRFTALVVSRHVKETRPKPGGFEREWLQQIAYQHGGIGDLCETEFEFGAMVAATEREACAQAALDAPIKTARQDQREACAAAIRARGES